MSTKRESASIDSGDDHKQQKMNNDTSVKGETGMIDYLVRNNMLPSIVVYLSPRDLLTCLQTSKKWKRGIDTDYVWTDILLPSLALHLPPRDISTCIQASKKWKDKIDTVDTFWEKVVTTTVPPKVVDLIEEMASKIVTFYSRATKTIDYESIAMAFDLKNNKTIEGLGGILLFPSVDDFRKLFFGFAFDLNKTVSQEVLNIILYSETAHGICPFLSENPHSVANRETVFTAISNNSLKSLPVLYQVAVPVDGGVTP